MTFELWSGIAMASKSYSKISVRPRTDSNSSDLFDDIMEPADPAIPKKKGILYNCSHKRYVAIKLVDPLTRML